jgi:Uma2 family endonuclease
MGLAKPLPRWSVEEYLDLERLTETRHEFLDGVVYAMAGESFEHSTICFNLAVAVGNQLRGSRGRGFSPNMKIQTGDESLYAYPDLAVVCGEPVYHDTRRDVVTNPAAVFEVLSPSTENYDRTEKFARYKEVATLTGYMLIAQNAPRVEHHQKRADGD